MGGGRTREDAQLATLCRQLLRFLIPFAPSRAQLWRLSTPPHFPHSQVLEISRSRSWSLLAFKLWRTYVFVSGVYGAVRVGSAGLRAGVRIGKALVTEQTTVMVREGGGWSWLRSREPSW